jgi:peptide/nickel transport system substrate-binding protein
MPKNEDHLLEEFLEGRISRRDLIKGLVAAGLSASAVGGLLAEVGASDVAEASAPLATKPKRGGTGRFGTVVPATDVDPVTMFNEGAIFTTQLACEYLCYPRPNYSLAPKLATSWKPNSNATVWTFHLRKGVKWHDGSAFTADDVVATFDRLTNPKNNSGALSAYKGILSTGHTRKVNSHTVQFHLDRPFSDFPYLVSAFTYNSVILPKNFKIGTFTQGGIGTGA